MVHKCIFMAKIWPLNNEQLYCASPHPEIVYKYILFTIIFINKLDEY